MIHYKNKCINYCKNDDEYKYEYNNQCMVVCPDNLKRDEEQKLCLDKCYSNQFKCDNICYNDCNLINGGKKILYEIIKKKFKK